MDLDRNNKLREEVLFFARNKSEIASDIKTEKSRWSHWLNGKAQYGDGMLERIEKWLSETKSMVRK